MNLLKAKKLQEALTYHGLLNMKSTTISYKILKNLKLLEKEISILDEILNKHTEWNDFIKKLSVGFTGKNDEFNELLMSKASENIDLFVDRTNLVSDLSETEVNIELVMIKKDELPSDCTLEQLIALDDIIDHES